MSPSIDMNPDLLGMFKQQDSHVPTSVATDLETLCAAVDLLQTGGQADLDALAGSLSRLSAWVKVQEKAVPGDVSGWTSEPFGVKGMGGMVTCHNERWEVIFNLDGSGRPYMGMWQSRLSGENGRSGSFRVQAGGGGTQLMLEGAHPLQVSLQGFEASAWGAPDAFYQQLNSTNQPKPPVVDSQPIEPQQPEVPPVSNIPEGKLASDAAPTILAKPRKHPVSPVPLSSNVLEEKPASREQPTMVSPRTWQCACGSMNKGDFCPKCGGRIPSRVVEQRSVPAQPVLCKQCGKALSPGARFCRNCGAEVKD